MTEDRCAMHHTSFKLLAIGFPYSCYIVASWLSMLRKYGDVYVDPCVQSVLKPQ